MRHSPAGTVARGALAALLLSACGGGSSGSPAAATALPTPAPTPAPTPDPTIVPAGSALTVVSAGTGEPLAGVTLHVAGVGALTTGVDGRAVLPARIAVNAPIDFTAPNVLDRLTYVRSTTDLRFTLWPRTGAGGLDERVTRTLVYTSASDDTMPVNLRRLGRNVNTVAVVPSVALQADPATMAAHQQAVDSMNGAQSGVRYVLATERPAASAATVVVTTSLDPADMSCSARTRGYTRTTSVSDEIASAIVVFCAAEYARSTTVTHELGHTFGLRHAPSLPDLMYGTFATSRGTTFSARESLLMRLMLTRRGGNRFPDDDRAITAAALRATEVITCD